MDYPHFRYHELSPPAGRGPLVFPCEKTLSFEAARRAGLFCAPISIPPEPLPPQGPPWAVDIGLADLGTASSSSSSSSSRCLQRARRHRTPMISSNKKEAPIAPRIVGETEAAAPGMKPPFVAFFFFFSDGAVAGFLAAIVVGAGKGEAPAPTGAEVGLLPS
mmetsp:Transcript_41834/g.82288  ORF Transcript_41834/g.82288 Transcript_41834/m.82288 type:complete len:162 (+) Transcript_41834:227-712(+)